MSFLIRNRNPLYKNQLVDFYKNTRIIEADFRRKN